MPRLMRTFSANIYQLNHVETIQHAHCRVRFSDKSIFNSLAKDVSTVRTHIETMRENSCKGAVFRFNGPMAYNMVQALAEFHPDYRCIDETILDNETLEAASMVSFGDVKKGGTFHAHPGFIDGLTQSGGFVMNANTKTNLGVEVFVNHGWDSFQLYERVTDDRQYQTYVQMKPAESSQWKGDVVILSGDRLIGSVTGLTVSGLSCETCTTLTKSNSCKVSREESYGTSSRAAQSLAKPAGQILFRSKLLLSPWRRRAPKGKMGLPILKRSSLQHR